MAKPGASKRGSGIIRVLVAATSAIRRLGLESTIKASSLLKLVGSAPALSGISAQVRRLEPDVLLLDLERAEHQFLSRVLSADATAAAMVALVEAPSPVWTAHALRSGIKGILLRDASSEEILAAIRGAYEGLVSLDAAVASDLARHVHVEAEEREAFDELSPREMEILRMLAEGLGNKQIAAALAISEHTVKFHISSILDKLGASTRTEAVTSGIRMGLIFV